MNVTLTDQLYDNGILLGALLQITGLSIYEVQAIIRGEIILEQKNDNIKALIMEGSKFRKSFASKLFSNNIKIEELNKIFSTNYSSADFFSQMYNPGFYLNQINFSIKDNNSVRSKLVELFRNTYKFNDNQIAELLEISATTVQKIK